MTERDDPANEPVDLDAYRRAADRARDEAHRPSPSDRFAEALEASRARPAEFFAAWKAGVERMGPEYFRVPATSVAAATDRDELRPDFEVIEQALPVISGGQRRFLIAMCQFYADSTINAICEELDIEIPTLADLALLDDDMRSILVRLLNAYTGW